MRSASAVARAEAARAAWGESQTVLVAQHRLEFGAVVGASDVASESWPAAVVPRGAGEVPDDVIGRTVVEVDRTG